jgi:hypothetical protein
MLNVIKLNAIILNIIMRNVVMLCVMAPHKYNDLYLHVYHPRFPRFARA